ncbi:MAG: hypothetical protein AAFV53_42060, partial [Myxococcota bacterium]
MSIFSSGASGADASESIRTLDAIIKSQAMIQFDPNGNILDANHNFLHVMGYRPLRARMMCDSHLDKIVKYSPRDVQWKIIASLKPRCLRRRC